MHLIFSSDAFNVSSVWVRLTPFSEQICCSYQVCFYSGNLKPYKGFNVNCMIFQRFKHIRICEGVHFSTFQVDYKVKKNTHMHAL